MKIIYGILTTEKYHNSRCKLIKESWGKNQNIFFLSDKEEKCNFIKLSNDPSYNAVYIKLINGILYFNKNIESDWYFIGDDDVYVFTKSLIEFLSDKNPNEEVVYGQIRSYCNDQTLFYPLGGAGFVISKSTLKKISNKIIKDGFKPYPFGDVTIGYIFRDCQITLKDDYRFHSQRPDNIEYNLNIDKSIKDNFTFHYINEYWNNLLSSFEV